MTNQKSPNGTAPVGAAATPASNTSPDNLIPDPIVCAEFGVTAMTLWRWTHDTELNFPPAIAIPRCAAFESFTNGLVQSR